MSDYPLLVTPRLRLRELIPSDAASILVIHGNAKAMKYFGTNPIRELAEAEELVQKFVALRSAPNPGVRWALEEKASGQLVGTCGLFAWNKEWCKCGTGYELTPAMQGRGLMREALVAAFEWGFAEMHLNRIEAQIHPANEPSLRLAHSLGFQTEGLLREVACWGNGFHDLLQLGLLRNNWARGGSDANPALNRSAHGIFSLRLPQRSAPG